MSTDPTFLTTEAYADERNYEARRAIYRFATRPVAVMGWALDRVTWRGDERVVDVGCGNGHYLAGASERTRGPVIGLDLSIGMLHAARSNDRGSRLAVSDAQCLPLPDACADVALAMHMLYHVPDIALAIRELRRIVRPGGVLLATTNAIAHLAELHTVILDRPLIGRFPAERAPGLLRASFDQIEQHDLLGELVVTDVQAVVDYAESMRGMFEAAQPRDWDETRSAVREAATRAIASTGAFRLTTHAAAFVCR